jgi:hypothetical protein
MINSLKPILVTSLAVLATMSLHGATRYINYTGGTGSKTTNLYEANNWSGTVGYSADENGNAVVDEGDVISLRVRGSNGASSAAAPAVSNLATYQVDSFNVGDFGESHAQIASGHTLTARNVNVGQATNNTSANGDGTVYIDGTLNVSNQLNVGQNAININSSKTNTSTGELVIRNGGTVNVLAGGTIGVKNYNGSPAVSGTLTVETGGTYNNGSSTQSGGTSGMQVGKQSGSVATLDIQGGTVNLFSLVLGDNNTDNTGQTVNINLADGLLNMEGWINGQVDDATVTRNLTMDDGIIYLVDGRSNTTGLYNGKQGEIKQFLGFFGTGADTGVTYSGTNSATVVGGGLSDAAQLAELQANYTSQAGSVAVTGGTIHWGRDNDLFTDTVNLDGDGDPQNYGRFAVWAVPEPSSAALIAGLLCIGLTLTRRRS